MCATSAEPVRSSRAQRGASGEGGASPRASGLCVPDELLEWRAAEQAAREDQALAAAVVRCLAADSSHSPDGSRSPDGLPAWPAGPTDKPRGPASGAHTGALPRRVVCANLFALPAACAAAAANTPFVAVSAYPMPSTARPSCGRLRRMWARFGRHTLFRALSVGWPEFEHWAHALGDPARLQLFERLANTAERRSLAPPRASDAAMQQAPPAPAPAPVPAPAARLVYGCPAAVLRPADFWPASVVCGDFWHPLPEADASSESDSPLSLAGAGPASAPPVSAQPAAAGAAARANPPAPAGCSPDSAVDAARSAGGQGATLPTAAPRQPFVVVTLGSLPGLGLVPACRLWHAVGMVRCALAAQPSSAAWTVVVLPGHLDPRPCRHADTPAAHPAGQPLVLSGDVDLPSLLRNERCRLAVHHGGSGTTAACLLAGVPQLVLPVLFDQPLWARRVESLGAGARLPDAWSCMSQSHCDAGSGARQQQTASPPPWQHTRQAGPPADATGACTPLDDCSCGALAGRRPASEQRPAAAVGPASRRGGCKRFEEALSAALSCSAGAPALGRALRRQAAGAPGRAATSLFGGLRPDLARQGQPGAAGLSRSILIACAAAASAPVLLRPLVTVGRARAQEHAAKDGEGPGCGAAGRGAAASQAAAVARAGVPSTWVPTADGRTLELVGLPGAVSDALSVADEVWREDSYNACGLVSDAVAACLNASGVDSQRATSQPAPTGRDHKLAREAMAAAAAHPGCPHVIVDVGACFGAFVARVDAEAARQTTTVPSAREGVSGRPARREPLPERVRVLAVEAARPCLRALQSNIARNGWLRGEGCCVRATAVHAAVVAAASPGDTAELGFVAGAPSNSGVGVGRAAELEASGRLSASGLEQVRRLGERMLVAPAQTLSALLGQHLGSDARIALLKIDVEGSEAEVLRGISDADWLRIDRVVVETTRASAFSVRALLARGLPGARLRQSRLSSSPAGNATSLIHAVAPARGGCS